MYPDFSASPSLRLSCANTADTPRIVIFESWEKDAPSRESGWKEILDSAGELEGAVLCEGVARKRSALRRLRHLDANRRRVRSGNSGGAQHGVLRKHFAVDLGDT